MFALLCPVGGQGRAQGIGFPVEFCDVGADITRNCIVSATVSCRAAEIVVSLCCFRPDTPDFCFNSACAMMDRRVVGGKGGHRCVGCLHIFNAGESTLGVFQPVLQFPTLAARQVGDVECFASGNSATQCIALNRIGFKKHVFDAQRQARVFRWRRRFRCQVHTVGEVVHQGWPQTDNSKPGQLQQNKRHHAGIHLDGLDRGRRDPTQIKQGKPEWWGQERGLHVNADHHAQPYGGDVCGRIGEQDRRDDRHDHNRDFDKIEEKPENEDHRHHDDKLGDKSARQALQEVTDDVFSAERAESSGKHGGTQQDDEYQRRCLRGFHHDTGQRVVDLVGAPEAPADRKKQNDNCDRREGDAEPLGRCTGVLDIDVVDVHEDEDRGDCHEGERRRQVSAFFAFHKAVARHDRSTDSADRAGLVDRSNAHDDRAQHGKNQGKGRYECQGHLDQELGIVLAFKAHRRRHFRPDEGDDQDVRHVQQNEDQAGDQCAQEHVAGAGRCQAEFGRHRELSGRLFVIDLAKRACLVGRAGELICQDDEDDRRGDDLAEGT